MRLVRRVFLILASLALLPLPAVPQGSGPRAPAPEPWPTGTFSILAYDPVTGELGGAVQSRVFSVGNDTGFSRRWRAENSPVATSGDRAPRW